MRITKAHIAKASLIISAVAAILAAGLFIVQREFNLIIQICLTVMVFGIALFVILEPRKVREALTGRRGRYGSNLALLSLAFLGIVVAVNYLVMNNTKRWDLTEAGKFTLSPETIDVIESLPGSVTVLAFFSPNLPTDQADALLDQYQYHSDGKIEYQFINPYEDPLSAEKYDISRDGTLVLVSGEEQTIVNSMDEREITGALVRIISPGERKVYFLTGHGEYDPEAFGDDSYSQVKSTLGVKNYTVEKLQLANERQVPEDASAVVIAGPVKPVPQAEVDLLDDYLQSGGSMLILQEPTPMTDLGDEVDPLSDYLENEWGIILGDDMIVDLNSSQPLAPFAEQYGNHLITEKLTGITTVYPTARSVTTDSSKTIGTTTDLVLTSPRSWAETDLDSLVSQSSENSSPAVQPDQGSELIGPISLAVTMEDNEIGSRLAVFGDSDFAADINFFQYGNGDMFVNSLDWVTKQDEIINLTPKEDIQRLIIPPGRYTMNLIFFGLVILLPGVVLLSGVFVWLRRRRRG